MRSLNEQECKPRSDRSTRMIFWCDDLYRLKRVKFSMATVVLPGDRLEVDPEGRVGPGVHLCKEDGRPVACRAGMLRGDSNNTVWVEYDSKRVSCPINLSILNTVQC